MRSSVASIAFLTMGFALPAHASASLQFQLQSESRLIRSLIFTFEGPEKASATEVIDDNTQTTLACLPELELSKGCVDSLRVYVIKTQAKLATLLPSVCEDRSSVLQELLQSQRHLRDRLDWDPGTNTFYVFELLKALNRVVQRENFDARANVTAKIVSLETLAQTGDNSVLRSNFSIELKELEVLFSTQSQTPTFEIQMLIESLKSFVE